VAPGSAAERAGLRVGDVVRFENESPEHRVLQHLGESSQLVDVTSGRRLTFTWRADPNNWTVSKHSHFAAEIALEFAAFAILLLRPNLLVARALAASLMLSTFSGFLALGHWTGNEVVAVTTEVLRKFATALGIASLGFVALGLSASTGPKRRLLAYATIALGALPGVVWFVNAAVGVATGYDLALGRPFLNQMFPFVILLGFVSVALVALQAHDV